jgi:hypothetical protein
VALVCVVRDCDVELTLLNAVEERRRKLTLRQYGD